MKTIEQLTTKIFADGADPAVMLDMYRNPIIKGFTTNPSLMHKAGITNYKAFALEILAVIKERPISFEVFSDDVTNMHTEALEIASWGNNVYVKIPVSTTQGKPTYDLMHTLAKAGIKQNITALMTVEQITNTISALADGPSAYISVFAGRIADTGVDPIHLMKTAMTLLKPYPQLELLWASSREILNIFQADSIGCHIITVSNEILKKLDNVGKNLQQLSLETIKTFREDAIKAGFKLEIKESEIA